MMIHLKKIALFAALMLGAQLTHAGWFGWSATVKAITPPPASAHVQQTVHSGTYLGCEQARLFVVNATFAGNTITDHGVCTPVGLRLPEKIVTLEKVKWPWPWPWPPVCLSCPYLDDQMIHVIFPEHAKQVLELKEKYNIDAYNRALLDLQAEYDLEDFEQAMFELENAVPQEQMRR